MKRNKASKICSTISSGPTHISLVGVYNATLINYLDVSYKIPLLIYLQVSANILTQKKFKHVPTKRFAQECALKLYS